MNGKQKIDGKKAAMIVVCTICCIQVWQPPQAIADRTIVFPKTPQPIGTLMTHPMKESAPLRMLGTSKGTITLKDGDALYLVPTPEGMRYFDELSKLKPADLQHLRLHDVPITQSNFKTVSKMHGLTRLDLSYSDVDDSVFQYIAELKNLEELDLSSTLVRGTALSKLKSLKHLTSLDLAGTRIHDLAVQTIVEYCPKLEKLNLAHTYITDDAISKIAKLQNLQKLRLSKTNITDKNINKLLSLKHLQKLSLSQTKITLKKLREMKTARPTCKFVFGETDD